MRLLPLLALLPLLLACDPPPPEPDDRPLRVMAYNIMCSFCGVDGLDDWDERTPFHAEIIAEHDPDLLALQEQFLFDDVALTLDAHPEYEALFYIDDGDGLFEVFADSTIYYKRDRFEVIDNGFIWMSETPDVPFSKGFADGTQFPRLAAWALLRQTTDGRRVLFASTHVDNNSPSQERSAPLFIDLLLPLADGAPVVLAGDFNSRPSSEAYQILDEAYVNTFDEAPEFRAITNEEPAPEFLVDDRIDHIWLAGPQMETLDWYVDMRVFGDRPAPPSDHYAIGAELSFPQP